mgnify:CR=1 FL=1
MLENERVHEIQVEIGMLKSKLYSSASNIGDWKINKIYEYRMQGLEDPYDFDALCKERQAARDRINELEEELKTLGY